MKVNIFEGFFEINEIKSFEKYPAKVKLKDSLFRKFKKNPRIEESFRTVSIICEVSQANSSDAMKGNLYPLLKSGFGGG
jgi:hypothetical protein